MNDGKIERELEQQISFVIWSFKNLFKCIEVSQAVLLLTIEKAESKAKKRKNEKKKDNLATSALKYPVCQKKKKMPKQKKPNQNKQQHTNKTKLVLLNY